MSDTQGSFGVGNATDVAALSFAIDSSQVVTAAQSLDGLKKSSDDVQDSYDKLTERSQRFIAVARDMGESISQMRRQFQDTSQSLDSMLASLDMARAKLDGTQASFAALSDAVNHVTALGSSFGVTSAALEGFANQSAMLGLSAGQTTLALQRITEALQNQTLAGQQVRQEIQGLGIDLAGLGANDSAGVLASVVSRLRQSQGGLGLYQTESSILGVTDPNTLSGLNNQSYIPVDQRRQIAYAQAAQKQMGATTDLVAREQRGYVNEDAEYDDLSSRYSVGTLAQRIFGLDFGPSLSSDQRGQLARLSGIPNSPLASEDDQLKALRYLQANPNSDLARAAIRPIASADEVYNQSYAGRLFRHLSDGTFGTNEADIRSYYGGQYRASNSFFAYPETLFGEGYDTIRNALNLYTPRQDPGDQRPVDGVTAIRNSQATAQLLARFGDSSLENAGGVAAQLRQLQDPATLKTFQDAFGTDSGNSQYKNIQTRLKRLLDQAGNPAGEQQDAANQQSYLLGIPEAQRPQAQALIKFLNENPGAGDASTLLYGPNAAGGSGSVDTTIDGLQGKYKDAFLKLFTTQANNAAAELLQTLDKKNAEAQNMLQATAAAGDNPVAIAAARLTQGISNEYDALPAGRRPEFAQFDARRRLNIGIDAQQQAQDRLVSARADLTSAYDSALGPSGSSARADEDNIKKFTDQIAAAGVAGQAAADAVAKTVDQFRQLEATANRVKFDGIVNAQSSGNYLDASFDRLRASSPASERPFLSAAQQALVPLYNQGDPALLGKSNGPQLDPQTALRISQISSQLGVPYSLAATIAQNEGAGDPSLGNAFQVTPVAIPAAMGYLRAHGLTGNYDPNTREGSSYLGIGYLGYLQSQPGFAGNFAGIAAGYNGSLDSARAFVASGDQDLGVLSPITQRYVQPFLPTASDLLQRGRSDPSIAALLASLRARSSASTGAQIADINSGAAPRNNAEAQILALLGAGETGQARLYEDSLNTNVSNPALGAVQASQRVAGTTQSFQEQLVGNRAATEQQIQQANQMAEAYLKGGDAVAKLTAAFQAQREALATGNVTLDGNTLAVQQNARAQQLVTAALAAENEALAKQEQSLKQDTARTKYVSGIGITDQYDRQRQIGEYDYVQQQRQNDPIHAASDPNFDQTAKGQYAVIQQNKDLLASTDAVNSAFDQMGKSIFSTFENAAFSGQRFKRTLGELLQSLSQIILNLTIEKPLEDAFTKNVGGIFGTSLNGVGTSGVSGGVLGYFGNALGLGGGGGTTLASSALLPSLTTATDTLGPIPTLFTDAFARGGVFGPSGRINYHAAGSVLPGPTPFTDAAGNANVAGEAGPEAIMPLQVLPNGSLGVATTGGGRGQQIIVHTPITYNAAGGTGSQGVDPASLKMIQKQIEKAATEATKATILNMQRPGGMLYGTMH